MSTDNNNNNDDGRTRNFAATPSSILTGAAIGIIALVLTFSGIAASSSIPMAAAQTLEEGGVEEQNQTATAFFPDDNNDNNETGRLSILGALGISVVEGVKVTSIALNEDASEVTVTVSSVEDNNTTTEDNATANTTIPFNTGDNNETDVTTSTTTTTAGTTPGVTVAAFKTQLDLASLLQGHMMMEKSQEAMPHMGTTNQGAAQGDMMTSNSSGMPMFDIMSFIESLKIGSDIEQEGWTSPVEVTVPVISGDTAVASTAANTTTSTGTSDTEIVIVVVIPFTGETETAATVSAEEEVIEEDNQ